MAAAVTAAAPGDGLPAVPAAASEIFGARLGLAQRYARLLATDAVTRGLIGPREASRLWDRHLLNCAVVSELIPPAALLVDVGSGAGLPGLAIALRRPDVEVVLVEALRRRVEFLREAIGELGLADQVRVAHGRVEDAAVRAQVPTAGRVIARAVAPLDRLVTWCLPLLEPNGSLLAVKGAKAREEVAALAGRLGRAGLTTEVVACGVGQLAHPATVVVVNRIRGSS